MPDNAIYYQVAYTALVVLFAAYTASILVRRRSIARKREELERQR